MAVGYLCLFFGITRYTTILNVFEVKESGTKIYWYVYFVLMILQLFCTKKFQMYFLDLTMATPFINGNERQNR
jgi:hypothetical protein